MQELLVVEVGAGEHVGVGRGRAGRQAAAREREPGGGDVHPADHRVAVDQRPAENAGLGLGLALPVGRAVRPAAPAAGRQPPGAGRAALAPAGRGWRR